MTPVKELEHVIEIPIVGTEDDELGEIGISRVAGSDYFTLDVYDGCDNASALQLTQGQMEILGAVMVDILASTVPADCDSAVMGLEVDMPRTDEQDSMIGLHTIAGGHVQMAVVDDDRNMSFTVFTPQGINTFAASASQIALNAFAVAAKEAN